MRFKANTMLKFLKSVDHDWKVFKNLHPGACYTVTSCMSVNLDESDATSVMAA